VGSAGPGRCARPAAAGSARGPDTAAAGLRRAGPAAAPGSCPPAQPADMSERLAQLKQLGELLSAGVLTQAEFDQHKARILNG